MAKSPNLNEITDFELLLQYLEDNLGWPLDGYKYDDVTFTYEPEELGLKEQDAVRVRSIRQLRPLADGQPWGIFFVEFEKKKLPVVLLRRILSHLVLKKRASANSADRARWHAHDILFISQFGGGDSDREMAFAHFKDSQGDLPTLNVLGWDGGDTQLKLSHLRQELEANLHWPTDPRNADAWRAAWSKPFKHGVHHTIRTANDLAEALAALAKRIRDAAKGLMMVESEKGALRKMHKAFKTALIHDLTEEGFADTYAQTITYGLLTAAISRTDLHGGKHGTNLVADNVADMVPITNPFLKEMLQSFLKVGGRKGGIDFDELGVQDVVELLRSDATDLPAVIRDFGNRTGGEDPVIHFYEHFLAKYNKQLKVERGVFYTPKPVVGFIVRSVDDLLRTEFGIEDGLASTITWREMAARNSELKIPVGTEPDSPFVVVLDPATGTATFLVEVIDLVHKRLEKKWNDSKGDLKAMPKLPKAQFSLTPVSFKDYWNNYVALSLLRRLHGYELMMAPYAIAHMKIGLKLAETGYRFGVEERARVYLTNTLEPPSEGAQMTIADWAPALAHEGQAVNAVKKNQQFTVVIGNPPYSGHSSNNGEWVRQLMDDYYVEPDGRPLQEKTSKWLNDDYVKFTRFAEWLIGRTGEGILAYISNHGFLENPTFRGMRWHLLGSFNSVFAVDLHGSSKKKEEAPGGGKDENVFDIQTGVSMNFFVKAIASGERTTARVLHADFWGKREDKYEALATNELSRIGLKPLRLHAPFYQFKVLDDTRHAFYVQGISLARLFRVSGAGITTAHDDFVIDHEKAVLVKRFDDFRDAAGKREALHEEFSVGAKEGWDILDGWKALQGRQRLSEFVKPIAYRPFDKRFIFYEGNLVWRTVEKVMGHMLRGINVGMISARSNKSPSMDHVFVTDCVMETKCGESTTQSALFPLYNYPKPNLQTQAIESGIESNLDPKHSSAFANGIGLKYIGSPTNRFEHGEGDRLTPLDMFDYSYAILHSPAYRDNYKEFLKSDFPRIPYPGEVKMFRALVQQGAELRQLHLLEAPSLTKTITRFIGPAKPEVEKVSWSDNTVWIDKAQRIGFKGVPEAVWQYHVGGYQVCEKWLKDRGPKKGKPGRTLSAEDIAHYQKIVVALSETIRIQKEIDEVIEQHGGWPGAFATNTPLASDASDPSTSLRAGPLAQPKATKAKEPKGPKPEDGPGYIPDPGEIPFG